LAGYSDTPLLQKLGIREGHRVLLRNAPARMPEELKGFVKARMNNNLDVVLLFAKSRAVLRAEFASLTKAIQSEGAIWVAWPKKASGIETDLTENGIRQDALPMPFVDVKVCAID
jgi:hypothetical protein